MVLEGRISIVVGDINFGIIKKTFLNVYKSTY